MTKHKLRKTENISQKMATTPQAQTTQELLIKLQNENKELKKQLVKLSQIIENFRKEENKEPVQDKIQASTSSNIHMEVRMEDDQMDQGDFIQVLKKRNEQRKATSSKHIHKQQQAVPTPNKPSTSGPTHPLGQIKTMPQQNETTREVTPILKPPPINILYQDPKETIQLINHNNNQIKFHIKRLSKTKHVLQLNTLEDFQKAKSTLSTAKVGFYTYTPKELKNHNFLPKELPESFSG